ncbi:MAG: aspartate aminotransferase family protein [Acidobacteria bacterium]|nr:aspartate aminotransferase family protein [Acidobacteriota bacterium]
MPAALPPARQTPLAMSAETFRQLGHDLVDRLATFLEAVPDGPVTRGEAPARVRELLDAAAALPDAGAEAGPLLARAADLLCDHSLLNGHPRFLGYITSSPAPIGMLADLLAAAVNPNVGAWRLAPMASEIEAQTVRWIADLVGYPSSCGGLLVSGGNMANMVALFAARVSVGGAAIRRDGIAAGGRRYGVYASEETHTWLQKATDLAGLGTDAIRWIPTDASQRVRVEALREAIATDRVAGRVPLMVVGTAGSVSTGAVDPLRELAALSREHGAWFHVDGAYGGFAAAVPGTPEDLQHLAQADSVALDPHKWLYAPLEAGCVLVRDEAALRHAFSYHPPYYHFGDPATNYFDLGVQNSRGFRALKVWLALAQAGRRGYVQMIGEDIALSERLAARLATHGDFEVLTQGLSITTFRYVPAEWRGREQTPAIAPRLDALNEALLDRLQASGELFVSNAVVCGRYALRACIVNIHTSAADVDAVPALIAAHGRAIHTAGAS